VTLRPAQIAAMRATSDAHLPDVVNILRRSRVSDGGGGYEETWAPIAEDVPCRIGGPLGGETDERNVSKARLVDEESQQLWFPANQDIEEADRIEWPAGERLYEVITVFKRGSWELARRVRVMETDPED
jgi:hypothetical protein